MRGGVQAGPTPDPTTRKSTMQPSRGAPFRLRGTPTGPGAHLPRAHTSARPPAHGPNVPRPPAQPPTLPRPPTFAASPSASRHTLEWSGPTFLSVMIAVPHTFA